MFVKYKLDNVLTGKICNFNEKMSKESNLAFRMKQ